MNNFCIQPIQIFRPKYALPIFLLFFPFVLPSQNFSRSPAEVKVDLNAKKITGKLVFDNSFFVVGEINEKVTKVEFRYRVDSTSRKKWMYLPRTDNSYWDAAPWKRDQFDPKDATFRFLIPGIHPNTAYTFEFKIFQKNKLEKKEKTELKKKVAEVLIGKLKNSALTPDDILSIEEELTRIVRGFFPRKKIVSESPNTKIISLKDPELNQVFNMLRLKLKEKNNLLFGPTVAPQASIQGFQKNLIQSAKSAISEADWNNVRDFFQGTESMIQGQEVWEGKSADILKRDYGLPFKKLAKNKGFTYQMLQDLLENKKGIDSDGKFVDSNINHLKSVSIVSVYLHLIVTQDFRNSKGRSLDKGRINEETTELVKRYKKEFETFYDKEELLQSIQTASKNLLSQPGLFTQNWPVLDNSVWKKPISFLGLLKKIKEDSIKLSDDSKKFIWLDKVKPNASPILSKITMEQLAFKLEDAVKKNNVLTKSIFNGNAQFSQNEVTPSQRKGGSLELLLEFADRAMQLKDSNQQAIFSPYLQYIDTIKAELKSLISKINALTKASNQNLDAIINSLHFELFNSQRLSLFAQLGNELASPLEKILDDSIKLSNTFKRSIWTSVLDPANEEFSSLTMEAVVPYMIQVLRNEHLFKGILQGSIKFNGKGKSVRHEGERMHIPTAKLILSFIEQLDNPYLKIKENSLEKELFNEDELALIKPFLNSFSRVIEYEEKLDKLERYLKNVENIIPDKITEQISVSLRKIDEESRVVSVEGDRSPYLDLDAGILYSPQNRFLSTYQGISLYFTPLNLNTPLSKYRKACFTKPFCLHRCRDLILKQTGLFLGVTQTVINNPQENNQTYQALLGGNLNIAYGASLRLTNLLKFTFGGLLYKQKDVNPAIDKTHLVSTWQFGLSIEVPIFHIIGDQINRQ